LIKKRSLILAVVLIGAAVAGLAAWGYARPAIASPERARSEGKSFGARNETADKLHGLKGRHGFSHSESRDEESDDRESDDRDDVTVTPGGLTTTTTAGATTTTTGATTATTGATTTTTGATTTTTGATTTTTGATTTTTQRATTTTTQATTTTTAINAASLFSALCARCHGPSGTQIRSTLTASQISTYIGTGGSMSSYASSLNTAQKTALANYVAGGGR
jgi:mono/diheme cytochrome c family protein